MLTVPLQDWKVWQSHLGFPFLQKEKKQSRKKRLEVDSLLFQTVGTAHVHQVQPFHFPPALPFTSRWNIMLSALSIIGAGQRKTEREKKVETLGPANNPNEDYRRSRLICKLPLALGANRARRERSATRIETARIDCSVSKSCQQAALTAGTPRGPRRMNCCLPCGHRFSTH